MNYSKVWIFIFIVWLAGCGTTRETSKYQLSDGYYKSKLSGDRSKMYIDNGDDTIYIYAVRRFVKSTDTLSNPTLRLPQVVSDVALNASSFNQASFDIDFLTIPFKYRPALKDFPRQFNTNLNGAVYAGYRNDVYQLIYKKTPLKNYQRQTQHYGFSFGLFTGLGGTAMNPFVTNNQNVPEYDGVVWSKGLAGIIGINNFTIGLALGFDDLLDSNKKYWIYQQKPWVGLAFGLNIN